MDPINYSQDVQTPFQAALQGYQAGSAIRNDQQQQQALQQAQARQRQMNVDLQAAAQDHTLMPNVMIKYPEIADKLKVGLDATNSQAAQQTLSQITPIYAALQNGNVNAAVEQATNMANAYRNAGMLDKANDLDAMIEHMQTNPQDTAVRLAGRISVLPGGDKILDGVKASMLLPSDVATGKAGASKAQSEAIVSGVAAGKAQAKTELDNQNLKSQIAERAARLRLDQDKLTTDTQVKLSELTQKYGQLPDDARKLVNDSAVAATSSEAAVQQYQQLAGKIDALGGSWGSGGTSSAGEWLSRAVGNEDAVSALKREYTRMASQGLIKLLPPGPASDKDIANAKEGIPNANASPAVVSSYLRGMAKLSAYDAVLNNAKAEWAGAVQHLGRTKADIVIDGTRVPAGTTFNEFARGYLASKADALDSAARIGGRGYMRFAIPPTGSPSAGTPASSGGATGAY